MVSFAVLPVPTLTRHVRGGVLVVLLAAGCLVAASPTTTEAEAQGNPLAGVRLYVDHHSPSWHQWRVYRRSGQRRKTRLT